ncbi:hypothetical protein AtNW77_Chr4g0275401 [Arabidopsis thaliana]
MQASFCQNLVVACLVLESAVSGYSAPAKDKLCTVSVWFVAKIRYSYINSPRTIHIA